MKLPKTLSELKRQNAQPEDADEHETATGEELELEANDNQADAPEGDELVDENEAEDVPAWLETGEGTDETESDVQVPLKAHIAQRKKFQGNIHTLRTDIDQRDEQIDALTKTIQELQQTITPQSKPNGAANSNDLPPVLSDFDREDNPDTAYQKAMLEWSLKTVDQRNNDRAAQQAQAEIANNRELELTRHYERAAKLVEAGQLTGDEYREADAFIRQTIENTRPGMGRTIFNTLFADLGKGSEKVLISLYRKPAQLNQLQRELTADQSGIRASAFLGRLAGTFERDSSPTSISSAPKPGSKVKGDRKGATPTSKLATKLKKEYDAAHSKGNIQGALNVKKKARAGGVDVSRWAYD